ncbi:endonuclease/exonuclease/phosphatase family protein [Luteolibacter sp. AS25]|uniref:endonuclease/exonuclease/phosphatase family protein n=1 Tax=Luteolibacter sp. AS25 TaxID=3135776 RepID=UPI00398A554D
MNVKRLFASLFAIAALSALVVFALKSYRTAETPPWHSEHIRSAIPDESPSASSAVESEFTAFNFVSYNVKNWLISTQTSEKTAESKSAVISMIKSGSPDIVGLSEIGSEKDVAEIQDALVKEGVDLPHTYYCGGVDKIRHLAILSRFPITSFHEIDPEIPGTTYSLQRGLLDVTIRIGERDVRFLGLHLKSKRVDADFDQELLRLEEAKYVRKHIDSILEENPEALLIAYGDWNNSLRSLSTRAILGIYRTPGYMSAMHIGDSRGEKWTHNWAYDDNYSRIDFVTVSHALRTYVNKDKSRILDDPYWNTASDHRPLLIHFEP